MISVIDTINTATDHTNQISNFKIDYFIDEDGLIIDTTSVNYKLYNLNVDTANTFKIVCTVDTEYLSDTKYNALTHVQYIVTDLTSAELDYSKNEIVSVTNLQISNTIDFTNTNAITDGTEILITSTLDDATSYNTELILTDLTIGNDELVNINISLTDSTISPNINNINVFSSITDYDFIDVHIKTSDYYYISHIDITGKTNNVYSLYLTAIKNFYTLGNLPHKCKS